MLAKESLFLPDELHVGYQTRTDTYTQRLAYVVYKQGNKIAKQTSWERWSDDKIAKDVFENKPTEGFVLNKKAGDYSGDWGNHRQAYARVYDPRNFEFEITIDNLLYIIEIAGIDRGGLIQGKLIYTWDGAQLVLLPEASPSYAAIVNNSAIQKNKEHIRASELIFGNMYQHKKGYVVTYLGKHPVFSVKYENYGSRRNPVERRWVEKSKDQYWFGTSSGWRGIEYFAGIGNSLLKDLGRDPNLQEYLARQSKMSEFSPINPDATTTKTLTLDEFKDILLSHNYYRHGFAYNDNSAPHVTASYIEVNRGRMGWNQETGYQPIGDPFVYEVYMTGRSFKDNGLSYIHPETKKEVRHYQDAKISMQDIEEVYNLVQPKRWLYYLENGELYNTTSDYTPYPKYKEQENG